MAFLKTALMNSTRIYLLFNRHSFST